MPGNLLRLHDHGGKARLIEGAAVKREPHPARLAWTGPAEPDAGEAACAYVKAAQLPHVRLHGFPGVSPSASVTRLAWPSRTYQSASG